MLQDCHLTGISVTLKQEVTLAVLLPGRDQNAAYPRATSQEPQGQP